MKLVFKPIRALNEPELRQVLALRDHPDTIKAITMTVSQMDQAEGETSKPAPLFPPAVEEAPTPKPVKAAVVDVEEVEEPKKVVKKSTPASEPTTPATDLSDIVGDWDD